MREVGQGLDLVKKRVDMLKGIVLVAKVNQGHNRITCYTGEIDKLYPSVFTFKTGDGTKTFSYAAVHTRQVKFLKQKEDGSD